jgi:hypothetical protein
LGCRFRYDAFICESGSDCLKKSAQGIALSLGVSGLLPKIRC